MKNKILNSSLIAAAAIILVVFAFYVRVGATADAVVLIKTSGMTCQACVIKITAALESQRGVAATEVDLSGGVVVAGYDSSQVAPERLAQTVTATGYHSQVARVLTPAEFRELAGREVGSRMAGGCGGCGSGGCGMKP